MSLYPTAGEGTVTRIPWYCHLASRSRDDRGPGLRQADDNTNDQRARGKVRRFCRANALTYLWSGTYRAAAPDRPAVAGDVARLLRRLRERFGRIPVLVVVERGTERNRLHVHFAVDRWLPHAEVERCWGQGYVWVSARRPDGKPSSPATVARYLAKYISKQIDGEIADGPVQRAPGHNRYYVSQGHQPECTRRRFATQAEAVTWLYLHYAKPAVTYHWGDRESGWLYGIWLSYPDGAIASWLAPWAAYVGNSGTAVP